MFSPTVDELALKKRTLLPVYPSQVYMLCVVFLLKIFMLKYLTFSELYSSKDSAFENFNLVVKTELLRRSLNFISYFFIFLIGLEILFSFNKALNANRIFVYGFGACLFYSFIEKMIVDSIDVFSLPYLIQAFPILLIPIYILLRRRYFFN